jgi:hypothetical protein
MKVSLYRKNNNVSQILKRNWEIGSNYPLHFRQGEAVFAYKMPKYKASPDDNKQTKRSREDDPATSGRGAAQTNSDPKYSDIPCKYSKLFAEKIVGGANLSLIEACYAKATWAKHCAALNSFKKFEMLNGENYSWPLKLEVICEYCSWAIYDGNLKPSTVRSYLSSLKIAHQFRNVPFAGDHAVVKALLQGAENLGFYKPIHCNARKVMTLPLLKLIGHQIASSSWSEDSKLVVWGACVTAFFGAFRFGEILPKSAYSYCEMDTLLWEDLKFRKDGSILVHVKMDKSGNPLGSFIDLFEFSGHGCCPVKTLTRLKIQKESPKKPVFQFANGKNLCATQLNVTLQKLLFPIIGKSAYHISGHSFRAGLPSAMADSPSLASKIDIQQWGRWSSNSYLLYTRLKLNQKRELFGKIVSILDK